MSQEWFSEWDCALQTAKELDLTLGLYDENSYPSGFGGGHVPAMCPQCLSQSIGFKRVNIAEAKARHSRMLDRPMKIFAFQSEKGSIIKDVTLLPANEWGRYSHEFLIIYLLNSIGTAWQGGFGPIDVLRPEATAAFLSCTHEKYYRRYGEYFDSLIHAVFTDEPYIQNANTSCGEEVKLPFSYWFAHQFQKKRGYSIIENLPALYGDVEYAGFSFPPSKVRYDYYETLHELWKENYLLPIYTWCKEHHLPLTGHYFEHNWPLANAGAVSPDVMSAYEFMDWPGIDILFSHNLKDSPIHPLQIALWEVRSVGNQLGKKRILCEVNGAGGWDSTFADYKRTADWLFAGGINFLCHHLCYGSISGARKRDHPQSFDWRQPWWDEFGQLNTYFGRLSYTLSQGSAKQRVLVLHPTTTGYLLPRLQEGKTIEKGNIPDNPSMEKYWHLLTELERELWDFDLGDEYILERHGAVEDTTLMVGQQQYKAVIIPGDMKNMRGSTYELVRKFAENGGAVLCCGRPGAYIDGKVSEKALVDLFSLEHLSILDTVDETFQLLNQLIGKNIETPVPLPHGFHHICKTLEDGISVHFWANHSDSTVETEFTVPGNSVCLLDPWNGKEKLLPYTLNAAKCRVTFPLKISPGESALLLASTDKMWDAKTPQRRMDPHAMVLMPHRIYPEKENWLPLQYCTLTIDGQTYRDVYFLNACELMYRHRGFPGNPWSSAIQYRNAFIDQAEYDPGNGFSLRYNCCIDSLPKGDLHLLVEHPELYALEVNGKQIRWEKNRDELDHHMGKAYITDAVQPGENTIVLQCDRFSVKGEIEPIYVKGNFTVHSSGSQWTIAPCNPMGPGTIISQGYPFYPGAILYEYELNCHSTPASAVLKLLGTEATCCSVKVNDSAPLLVGVKEKADVIDIADCLLEGKNRITVRLCASYKNTFGPHFDAAKPRREAWPTMWREAPPHSPSPDMYDLIPYGFDGRMEIFIRDKASSQG